MHPGWVELRAILSAGGRPLLDDSLDGLVDCALAFNERRIDEHSCDGGWEALRFLPLAFSDRDMDLSSKLARLLWFVGSSIAETTDAS